MGTAKKSTALVKAEPYALLKEPGAGALLTSAFEMMGVSIWGLAQMKIPAGGSPAWAITDLEGETFVQDVEVVIAAMRGNLKKWYRSDIETAGAAPPDCRSLDGVTGHGINSVDESAKPGEHNCSSCEWNQFGSKGKGKDCTDYQLALVLRGESMLPEVLTIPPTSLVNMRVYMRTLFSSRKAPWTVVTRLGIQKRIDGPREWGIIVPSFVRDLTPEEIAQAADVSKACQSFLAQYVA